MLAPHILIEEKFVSKRKKRYVLSKAKSLVKFKAKQAKSLVKSELIMLTMLSH